jgi:hypothetical protein
MEVASPSWLLSAIGVGLLESVAEIGEQAHDLLWRRRDCPAMGPSNDETKNTSRRGVDTETMVSGQTRQLCLHLSDDRQDMKPT